MILSFTEQKWLVCERYYFRLPFPNLPLMNWSEQEKVTYFMVY